jgi:hypothetical protein
MITWTEKLMCNVFFFVETINADNDNFDNKSAANYHRKTPLGTRMEATLFDILILVKRV